MTTLREVKNNFLVTVTVKLINLHINLVNGYVIMTAIFILANNIFNNYKYYGNSRINEGGTAPALFREPLLATSLMKC